MAAACSFEYPPPEQKALPTSWLCLRLGFAYAGINTIDFVLIHKLINYQSVIKYVFNSLIISEKNVSKNI